MGDNREAGENPAWSRRCDRGRNLQNHWGWKALGEGRNQIAVNEVPYARFVKEARFQQIGLRERGWTTIEEDLVERQGKILEAYDKGVKSALKEKGLTE